ncbi:MAG: Ig-like domain-containing protein [Flavobacterium sp.]|nr:Ig-like domain-containing protein [Flavobacterium sp.]
MKTKKLLLTIAILFIALISGCANDDFEEVVGVCPVVLSTNPIDGAFGVPLNQIITATFNEEMNPATINQSSFIITVGDVPVAGTVTYSGTTATFTPAARLAINTLYTGRIKTSVKDVDGNNLQTDYVWKFTTGLSPLVVSTDPANLAVNVPLNKVITATFNMSMNPLTINSTTFTIKQGTTTIAGTISPNPSGTTFTFTPNAPLAEDKVYTATITTGAKNLAGTELASDYVWTFKTLIIPIVVLRDPLSGATGVALNKVISATFNMPMNLLTVNATTFTVKQGAIAILGTISSNPSGTTFTFTPAVPLAGNTLYTVTITTGAQNTLGTALASDDVWSFRTLTPVIPPVNTTNGLGFGVFGGNAGITNQGLFTVVNGSMGTTAVASTVTGFTDGTNGDTYTVTPLNNGLVTNGIFADAPAPGSASKAATALAGLNAARALYLSISPAQMPGGIAAASELGGLTLAPGVYTAGSSLAITNGDLTLNAQGDPNAKWYFQAPSSLTVGSTVPRSVKFLNGVGNPANVYWYVGTAAVINYAGGGVMVGNIIANSGVTLSSPANSTNPLVTVLNGRAISLVASVTMVNTVINVPN